MTDPTPNARRVAAELVRPMFIEPGEFTDGAWCVDVCGHTFLDPEPRQDDAEFIAEAIRERIATALTRAAEEAREEERTRLCGVPIEQAVRNAVQLIMVNPTGRSFEEDADDWAASSCDIDAFISTIVAHVAAALRQAGTANG